MRGILMRGRGGEIINYLYVWFKTRKGGEKF
jgi:hypothetical protein